MQLERSFENIDSFSKDTRSKRKENSYQRWGPLNDWSGG